MGVLGCSCGFLLLSLFSNSLMSCLACGVVEMHNTLLLAFQLPASCHTALCSPGPELHSAPLCSRIQQWDISLPTFHFFFELTQLYAGEALKWSSKLKSELYILRFFRAWDFGCQSVSVSAGAGTVTMKRKVIIWMMQFVSLCFCIHWVYIACVNGTYATWWSALAILPPHFTRQSILRPSNLCEWLSILRVIICQIR